MGMIPKKETKRDQALIEDYLRINDSGWEYSIAQLGVKYARFEGEEMYPLTNTRIHQILSKNNISKNRIIHSISTKKKK